MGKLEKIMNVVIGVLMILAAAFMLLVPELGAVIVLIILSVSLLVYGIRTLVYYFSMARHMVGGRTQLYLGIIVIDFAVFTLSLTDVPKIYIMLYLLAVYAFDGVITLLRALEAKRNGAGSWKLKMAQAVINLLLAVACGVFINSLNVMVLIYCIGLVYSAVVRIINAFRKTAVVYIQ